ncbi:RICIN domain-containing protein [Desertivirga arenae]|uniref:RICIN domain-containing protein n=1 Tax=Desertivirga arenae TaxID=2810309 RepID=UPI001A95BDE3|nr:RICIN domain-containing protein [Pedobacter sp. SYSU D00823]
MKEIYLKKPRALRCLLQIAALAVFLVSACKKTQPEQAIPEEASGKSKAGASISVASSDAETMFNAYNSAFLVNSGGNTFYKYAFNNGNPDNFWELALDIMVAEDAYERSGTAANRTLVNNLCTSYLRIHPPPFDWDGWNDDVAWVGLMLARGYQITGTPELRTQAEYCFNFVYNRGWDTQYNGGGIWEQQPNYPGVTEIIKEALSNNTTGKLGCILYQVTGNTDYRTKAQRIYDWSRSRIYNASTGEVYRGIYRDNAISYGPAVYNQGTFIDFAAHLHRITGNATVLADAQQAADYVMNNGGNLAPGGIISNTATHLITWGDEFARGVGHLCRWNPQYWNRYYNFMNNNANAIWRNRRTDYSITWNGWNAASPLDGTARAATFASAVAMLQYTPAINPASGSLSNGTYRIINRATGLALDASGGGTANGTPLIQYGYNGGNNQRWTVTSLGNGQYSIRNVASGRSIDVNGASNVPGTATILYDYQGSANQRITLGTPASGYYTLFFQHDYQVLDVSGGSTAANTPIIQWGYSGGNNQQWQFLAP